jgi:hypothetical protein
VINFEENIGLVHLQAKQGYRWAQGAGVAMDYDDMFQEASVAFVLAAEGYKPETGLKFSTYFSQVAFSQFRKTIGVMTGVKNLNPTQRAEIADRKAENKRRAAAAQAPLLDCNYGLSPVAFSHIGVGDDDAFSFEETLESEAASPEQLLEYRQTWEETTARLSPLAKVMVEWLRDPPPELLKELQSQMAHADQRNAHGLRVYGLRDGLSIANIGKFLKLVSNVTDGELALAKVELEQVVKRIEEK